MTLLALKGKKVVLGGQIYLVERLGKYNRQLDSGIHFVIPFLEDVPKGARTTSKEEILDVPAQECFTKDNVSVKADAVVYWRLVDHARAFYEIGEIDKALKNVVLTQIRSEIGKIDLDETFTNRQEINEALLRDLDQITNPWGLKVTRVELKDLTPRQNVLDAMEQQMAAERTRRALILESEGARQAKVNEAQGIAESKVLSAKAEKEATILKAEGEAKQQELVSKAKAVSIDEIAKVVESRQGASEVLRIQLASEWTEMGQKMINAPGGSVLMVDPQSPASLLAALKNLQVGGSN
jgi:regulator of protease activity HflC (stomatin/prohibitin superfamily)